MSNDRFCRFATKLVVNGMTLVDGMLSTFALDSIINAVLTANDLPVMQLQSLYTAQDGFHMHHDIALDGGFIAFEVVATSGPVSANQEVGQSRPSA